MLMIDTFDVAAYNLFSHLHASAINWLWVLAAQYGIYVIILMLAFRWYKTGGTKERIEMLLQTLGVLLLSRGIITETIHFLYSRPRPFETFGPSLFSHAPGEAFPSGHTAAMAAMAFVLYAKDKKAGTYAILIAVLSGLARAVSGVHWISDVLGAIVISYVSYRIVLRLAPREKIVAEKQAIVQNNA